MVKNGIYSFFRGLSMGKTLLPAGSSGVLGIYHPSPDQSRLSNKPILGLNRQKKNKDHFTPILQHPSARRAKMKFRNRYEMRFLETARAYAYFFCLAFTMTANSLGVFYQSIIVTPIVVVTMGIGLNLILAIPIRSLFSEQIALFEKEQKVQFTRIVDYVARASIYYSVAVAVFDSVIFEFLKTSSFPNAFAILVPSAIYLTLAYAIYDREHRSRKLEEVLAASFQKTRLKNKYEIKLKRKKKRERAKEG
jgi:hypothetical protein